MLKILGIETSCDETAVAIVSEDKRILSNQVASQLEHNKYGGVVPEVASRSHMRALDKLVDLALEESGVKLDDIDAIAVTSGPGLIGGVIVGVMYAKAMAASLDKPILEVNHLEGHALTARLTDEVEFPFLLLLVSGGHTQFLAVKNVGEYEILGTTLDDAVGEAFDKTAKLLGLGYPGGPQIEKYAKSGNPKRFKFPRPLTNQKNCSLSFSGLKTAVRRELEKSEIDKTLTYDIAASFQEAVADVLAVKTKYAIQEFLNKYGSEKFFVLSGGVAANQSIRSKVEPVCSEHGFTFHAPPINLCGDNAAMIAWAGIEKYKLGRKDNLNFKPKSRWPLG